MNVVDGRNLYRWFVVYAFVMALCVGCGRDGGGGASSGLELSLQIPEGEQPDLFWYGVETRVLSITQDGRVPFELNWQPGQTAQLDLSKGDKLRFSAFDSRKRVLIEGEAEVSEEKKVSIPVHRVL